MLVYMQWSRTENGEGRKQVNRKSPLAPTASAKRWVMLIEKMGGKTDGDVNEMVKNRRVNMKNIASRPKIGCQV